MSNTKSTVKNISLAIILPTITVFSVLFYLFWAGPVAIILQEYYLDSLAFRNHGMLFISVIVCLIYIAILSVAYFKFPKIYAVLIGITLFLVLSVFAYSNILPYSYGPVINNITLTPIQSLLGFSKLYYLFDILLLGSLAYLSFISIKHKSTIFIFIFIFYNINNSIIFYNAVQKKLPDNMQIDSNFISLSSTEKNVLLITLDGFSIGIAEHFLTNQQIEPELTDWAKNFTFYDNVINIGVFTQASLPTIYGGEKFNPAQQFTDLYYNKMFDSKTGWANYYAYRDYALSNFQVDIKDYAQVSSPTEKNQLHNTPFLTATLYRHIPYFLRHLIADGSTWKLKNTNPWFRNSENDNEDITIIATKSKSKIGIIYNQYIVAASWWMGDSPITLDQTKTTADIEIVFKHNTKYAFIYITELMNQLKKLGIYDNTKIIINSDHGTHRSIRTEMVKSYSVEKKLNINTPVFMVKDFNSRSDKMLKDSRFLALSDTRGIIENAIGKHDLPDYTKTLPPKRVFNIIFPPTEPLVLNDEPRQKTLREYIKNNTLHIFKVTNQNPYIVLEEIKVDLTNIKTLPPYEIIED